MNHGSTFNFNGVLGHRQERASDPRQSTPFLFVFRTAKSAASSKTNEITNLAAQVDSADRLHHDRSIGRAGIFTVDQQYPVAGRQRVVMQTDLGHVFQQ